MNTLLNTKGMRIENSSTAKHHLQVTGRQPWELDPSALEWINARRFLKITTLRLRRNPTLRLYMQLPFEYTFWQWADYLGKEDYATKTFIELAYKSQPGTESSFGYALTLVGSGDYLDTGYSGPLTRLAEEIEECVEDGKLERIENISTVI
jgi:hypothetical protein